MTEKKNPLGPTGDHVRRNVRRIREARRLTYRQLSDELAAAGRPIPTLGLSRIENGERRVDADDLVALAAALQVNVSALLLPPTADEEVAITGAGSVPGWLAWAWADGQAPLISKGAPDSEAARLDFAIYARPRNWRSSEPSKFLRHKMADWLPGSTAGAVPDDDE